MWDSRTKMMIARHAPQLTAVLLHHLDSTQAMNVTQQQARPNSHLLRNLVGNLTGLIFSLLVGIWYTPYLVRHLGTEVFGLVPLATTITSYLSLLTIALTHSLSRFLTIAVVRTDYAEANRVYSTAFLGGLALIGLVMIPASGIAFSIQSVASIPSGMEEDVVLLFLLTMAGFLVTVAMTPFSVATWTKNRLDLRTLGDVIYNGFRVFVVVILFEAFRPKLWHVGAGLLIAAVVSALYSMFWSAKLLPMLTLRIKDATWETFRGLYTTSSWVVVDQIGAILSGGINILLVNRLLGARSGGEYAIALQWASLLRNLGSSLASVLAPTAMSHFARNDFEKMDAQAITGIRLTGFALALPVGLLCGSSAVVLRLWVGEGFVHLAPLMCWVVAPMAPVLATSPVIYNLMALNAVRVPAVSTIIQGIVNVALIGVFTGWLGWGLIGIAVATLIPLVVRNVVFLPLYSAMKTQRPVRPYAKAVASVTGATALVTGLSWLINSQVTLASWVHLGGISLLVSALFCLMVYGAFLSSSERVIASAMVQRIVGRSTGQ
jgi:membrane protein EpsK